MKLESVKNYFFIVKESWLENIKLLKPENISKLLLVSLRASVESLRSLFLYLLIFSYSHLAKPVTNTGEKKFLIFRLTIIIMNQV